jgi:segregation and condensation protein B
MTETSLENNIESVLFTASEPLTINQLTTIVASENDAVKHALGRLSSRLTGGIQLAEVSGTYRLVTAPESAKVVRQFLEDRSRQDLSRPALETLAIVAYKGPVTKAQIETIRGVASETMVRNLLARDLILEVGHAKEPGRPLLYNVSHTFLEHFGLTNTDQLPPLPPGDNDET